jgi:hypothetical protein
MLGESRKPFAQGLGNQPAHPIERDGEDNEVGGDPLARAEDHTERRVIFIVIDAADSGRETDLDAVFAKPLLQPGAVQLAQGNEW